MKQTSTHPPFSLKFSGLIVATSFMLLTLGMVASQLNQSQNLDSQAGGAHPLNLDTGFVTLTAEDFYIESGGKRFKGTPQIKVQSDPGTRSYTSLEAVWQENNQEMRLTMYFHADQTNWWSSEIRTYNRQNPPNWNYFKANQPYFTSPLGQAFQKNKFVITADNGTDRLFFKNLTLQAFANSQPITTDYFLHPPEGQTISFPVSSPDSGYGIGAYLYSNQNELVLDQSDFSYAWNVADPTIVGLTIEDFCVQGFQAPCPKAHGNLKGLKPGNTTITVSVTKISTNQIVATTSWNATVTPTSNSTQSCNGSCTIDADCNDDLICSGGACRNPLCTQESNCACTTSNTGTITYNPDGIPTCEATSSARLASGVAPFTHRFEVYSANDGGNGGIQGTEWDFDANGTWDAQTIGQSWIDHTFDTAGVYRPNFRVRGLTNWSNSCVAWDEVTVTAGAFVPKYDLNNDNEINLLDYNLMLTHYLDTLTE